VRGARQVFGAVVGVTLAGQLCAMAYEIAVAGRFGTGIEADALALTLTLVLAVANEVGGWITTLFIPHYIEARTQAGAGAGRAFFRACALFVTAGVAALGLALAAGAPALLGLLAPALPGEGTAILLLRLFAPLLVLLPLSTLLAGVLQAEGRFVAAALRQLCWYGLALAGVLALAARVGAAAVPAGMLAGLLLYGALLGAGLPAGAWRGADTALVGPRLRQAGVLLLPLAVASTANYLNIMIERSLAARLPPGSLAALTYAFRLLNFPVNLFLINATTMLFPPLALHAARNDAAELEALVRRALRLSLIFTVALAALAIALAEPAIAVLLQRGAFTARSTALTAAALTWYAPGVVGMAGAQVLSRAYQALHEIRRMVWTGILVVALNIVLMTTLTALIGFPGLPLAVSTSAITLFVAMLLAIRPRLPALAPRAVLGTAGRAVLAGAVAIAAVAAVRRAGFEDGIPALVAGAAAGLVAYGAALLALSRDDMSLALGFLVPGLARGAIERR
jgi:putative peptidoglycan lipid II flippase